jgi:hypothetical protein
VKGAAVTGVPLAVSFSMLSNGATSGDGRIDRASTVEEIVAVVRKPHWP